MDQILHWCCELETSCSHSKVWANTGASLFSQAVADRSLLLELVDRIEKGTIQPERISSILQEQNIRYDEYGDNTLSHLPVCEVWDTLVAKSGMWGNWDYGSSSFRDRWFTLAMTSLPWEVAAFDKPMTHLWLLIQHHAWAWDLATHVLVWESTTDDAWPNKNMAFTKMLLDTPGEPGKHTLDALIYQALEKMSRDKKSLPKKWGHPAWIQVQTHFASHFDKIQWCIDMDTLMYGEQHWYEREARLCTTVMDVLKPTLSMELCLDELDV